MTEPTSPHPWQETHEQNLRAAFTASMIVAQIAAARTNFSIHTSVKQEADAIARARNWAALLDQIMWEDRQAEARRQAQGYPQAAAAS